MSRKSKSNKFSDRSNPPAQPDRAGGAKHTAKKKAPSSASRAPNRRTRMLVVGGLIVVGALALVFLGLQVFGELMPWNYAAEISPNDARKELDAGAIIVDVRTYDEFVSGHIEHSLWMQLDQLPSLMNALPHDRLIIVVCRTGVRSAQAREILKNGGYQDVTSLSGGIQAWVAAGFPTVLGEPVRNN
jgi:rhodanese-related sulfurtransferase